MRIACIGNLNQAQFIAARYMRDMGHQVTLFLLEEQENFKPENDTYGPIQGIEIVKLPWIHSELYKVTKSEIRAVFNNYDFYSASEFGPAFLCKAGISTDLFIPIGTDLIHYPFKRPFSLIPETWQIDEMQFNLYQHGGIRKASAIFMNQGGDSFLESALEKLKYKGLRFPFSLPYLYYPDFEKPEAVSPFEVQVTSWKQEFGKLIMSHGRCEFLDPDSVHNKGTDILLKGFAKFIQKGGKAGLIMLEYGNDLSAAKQLVKELEIEKNVKWLPVCGRKDIFPLFKLTDVAVGNLYYPHWSYNVAMEAVAAGVPLIQKGPEDLNVKSEIYDFIKADHPDGLCEQLWQVLFESEGNQMGLQSKSWFMSHVIEIPLGALKKYLDDFAPGVKREIGFTREFLLWTYYHTIVRLLSKIKYRLNLQAA